MFFPESMMKFGNTITYVLFSIMPSLSYFFLRRGRESVLLRTDSSIEERSYPTEEEEAKGARGKRNFSYWALFLHTRPYSYIHTH